MKRAVILSSLVALLAGCIGQQAGGIASLRLSSAAGEVLVSAEVADSAMERSLGLMNRQSLGENEGMLFVFDDETFRSFWMKNTLIPLDIMFIDARMRIVDIQTMVPCEADPCPFYRSANPAKYALEVNAGFAEEKGIKVGDRMSFAA